MKMQKYLLNVNEQQNVSP